MRRQHLLASVRENRELSIVLECGQSGNCTITAEVLTSAATRASKRTRASGAAGGLARLSRVKKSPGAWRVTRGE
jgi:hypothetical protein